MQFNAILIARAAQYRPPSAMGAKYYPTIKDQKANLRFQQKQKAALPKLKKPPGDQSVPKGEKKAEK